MPADAVLTIVDPVFSPPARRGPLSRFFLGLIRDERDLPFVKLTLLLLAIFVPSALFLFLPGNFRWWMAPVYWALYLWFVGPFVLMLHNTSHRPLYRREHKHLNKVIPWGVGMFFGQSPETYFAHHVGMHHVDDNLPSDLSSTMRYQRDRFADFLKYFFSFLFFGTAQLYRYLRQRGRVRLARRFLAGEGAYFAVMITLLFVSWQPTVVVFVVPLLTTRLLLMMGNWAQHAFIDPDEPTNDYKTVVSFINSAYNRRCFNDGYHLGHHLKASLHWTSMPDDFLARRERMAQEGSLVFSKIDYFQIFVLLMLKRYRRLARYHVNLDPAAPLTEEQVVALLKRRVQRFDAARLAALPATA
jgi:hypothetical protein